MTFKELFCRPSDEAPESVTTVNFSKLTDTQLIMVALSEVLGNLEGLGSDLNEDLIDELKRRIKEEKKT